ncbi:MAG TPA: STELLO glycosyltransferase family protein [Allosphingosinicella sp.]
MASEKIDPSADRNRGAVVLTSIAPPNDVMRRIASDCRERGIRFYVVGDTKSPADFALDGCEFFSVDAQVASGSRHAELCPTRHYARKNFGYLMAMRQPIDFIVETDDDNMPSDDFYRPLPIDLAVPSVSGCGWLNVYRYFTDQLIWPRGLPLDTINAPLPEPVDGEMIRAPIQQGRADENPDVDAIFRLVLPLPFTFEKRLRLALGDGAWCPFNSQNTVFYREAFPLLYLPAYCSFRMTDIWRSFVAQRIAWANGWSVLFREATVVQDRNDHSLMRDFEDEISGYLGNEKIRQALQALDLPSGVEAIPDAMRMCYRALTDQGFVGAEELPLLDAWLEDLERFGRGNTRTPG